MQNRKEILSYIDTISLIVLSLVFLLFPLVFTSFTTDPFMLPKQILMGTGVMILLIFFGARTIFEGSLRLRATPFDLPIFLFALVLFVSAILSVNRTDSLIAFIPVLFAILLYFIIVNVVRGKKAILFLCGTFIFGVALSSLLSILSFFNLYILPAPYTHVQFFSTAGGLLDQALLFGIALPLAAYLTHPLFSAVVLHGRTEGEEAKKLSKMNIAFGIGAIITGIGLIITLYQLATTQNPLILPLGEGFRIGLASISRDTGRSIQSFLFGSGYGTFLSDFTRFKDATYNANPKLWSFSFFRSSSYFFELMATTGFLGILTYIFLLFKIAKEKWFFLPIVIIALASFFLPFSYLMQVVLFMILGIFALIRAQQNPRKYPITDLQLVALDRGLLSARPESEATATRSRTSLILPVVFALLLAGLIATVGYFSIPYILSDIKFQQSLVAAQQNNGGETYRLQREAIETFPYRDAYFRVFSQTNLALANNLAAAQPAGSSPSAETQQTILTLIQQSINSGRSAVTISPLTAMNWNNLSTIYRSLIGFGQNADQFSVLTNQQAIALDPNNPQQYLNLGGIYYQLGQWEEAQRNFQIAISLKPDFANGYYNLGHALESKGDLQNALAVYKTVQSLVAEDKQSLEQIIKEIQALEQKIAQGTSTPTQASDEAAIQTAGQQLDINEPARQLPERNPQVEIPNPGVTISPTPRASVTPSTIGSPAPSSSPSPAN